VFSSLHLLLVLQQSVAPRGASSGTLVVRLGIDRLHTDLLNGRLKIMEQGPG
jgi:hypothetical protein